MKTIRLAPLSFLSYAGFIAAWAALAQAGGLVEGWVRFPLELLFALLGIGIAGVLVPVVIARRTRAPFNEVSRKNGVIAGIALYLVAIAIEIAVFRSWFRILTDNPDDIVRMKYTFISLPLAIAVSVFCFVLAPRMLSRSGEKPVMAALVRILLPAASLGVLMYLLGGSGDPRLPAVMALVGALAGAGHLLTKKFFLSFLAVFFALHATTLAAGLYEGLGWLVAALGLAVSIAALFIGWMEDGGMPGEYGHSA